jgi:SagB-type dehydrogenase family enzyme
MPPLSSTHLTALVVESSSSPRAAPAQGLPPVELPGDPRGATRLPAPGPLDRSLDDVLRSRRSGGFRPGPVTLEDLSTLLSVTAEAVPNDLACARVAPPLVFPLIWNVAGVRTGVYRFDDVHAMLVSVGSNDELAGGEALMLQADQRHAAVILFLAVPMASWLHEAGDRGYRGATLQIGYLTDRLYLAAEALGLRYSASGGFAPASVDPLLGLDGEAFTTLFSFVVGPGTD